MALKFNTARPSIPIIMYNHNDLPNIPVRVNVPDLMQGSMNILIAQVLNKAGEYAHNNAARMYCFNRLVDMSCDNEFFTHVLDIAIKLVLTAKAKFPNGDLFNIIKESANTALLYVTSWLPHEEPELKALVSVTFIQESYKYLELYKQLREDNDMFGQQNNALQVVLNTVNLGNGMFLSVEANNGFVNRFPIVYHQNVPYVQVAGNNFPLQDQGGVLYTVVNGRQMKIADLFYNLIMQETQSRMQRQTAFGNQNVNPFQGQGNMGMGGNMNNQQQAMQGSVFSRSGGNENGSSFQPDNSSRYNDSIYTKQLQTLQPEQHPLSVKDIISQVPKTAPQPEKENKMTAVDSIHDTIDQSQFGVFTRFIKDAKPDDYGHVMIHTSLSSMVDDILLAHQGKGEIIRKFGTISYQHINRVTDNGRYNENLMGVSDISRFAVNLYGLIRSVKQNNANRGNVELTTLLASLVGLNNRMTDIINFFLKHHLGKKISVDNFCEDVSEVLGYVTNNLDEAAKEALEDFKEDFMSGILGFSPEIQLELLRELPEGAGSIYLPVNVSVTYIDGLSTDLGFAVKADPVVVDKSVAGLFFTVLDNLAKSKIIVQRCLEDYILTSDNVLLRVWKNIDGKWMIKKV